MSAQLELGAKVRVNGKVAADACFAGLRGTFGGYTKTRGYAIVGDLEDDHGQHPLCFALLHPESLEPIA